MAKLPNISFSDLAAPAKGAVVFLIGSETGLGKIADGLDGDGRLAKAMEIADFKGKLGSSLEVLVPGGDFDKFVVVGCGDIAENGENEWMRVGGKAFSSVGKCQQATVVCETGKGALKTEAVVAMAAGAKLRAYKFDTYKTKDKDESKALKLAFATDAASQARRAWKSADGVTDGVLVARDLVNEPANVLGTVEFAARAKELSKLGVDIEILDEKALKKLKMAALLGVAKGSESPARVVVMKWNGGKSGAAPIAFLGKGVVFDTGGISIKPSASMEDMKGDMGGAAAVVGLMHALAARKAKTNAVGIIGLVENMPDGKAQRPGDIVVSMSGQTIEILNTDAEGRLVLADILWYCQDRFKPKFMINLATLTGAILVALGNHHAGLFSNNDELSGFLTEAGRLTGEKVWRMPLGEEYDKLIDSKNADMKNIGGRWAGSITAGQFLQRFVNDVPWAHLDVAGTAMGSPKNEYSQTWASGYGVRLLDRLVSENYEK